MKRGKSTKVQLKLKRKSKNGDRWWCFGFLLQCPKCLLKTFWHLQRERPTEEEIKNYICSACKINKGNRFLLTDGLPCLPGECGSCDNSLRADGLPIRPYSPRYGYPSQFYK